MYNFLFPKNTILFTILLTNVLHCMDSMPKNSLSKSELQKAWEVLKHPGNNLVPPLEIQNKIAQEMITHIDFDWYYKETDVLVDNYSISLGLSPDGKKMVEESDSGLLLHDLKNKKCKHIYGNDDYVSYEFSPQGTMLGVEIDVLHVKTQKKISLLNLKVNHVSWEFVKDESKVALLYLPKDQEDDGQFIRTPITIFNTHDWSIIQTINVGDGAERCYFVAGGEQLLIRCWTKVCVYNVKSGQLLHQLMTYQARHPIFIDFNFDKKLCAISDNQFVHIFDTNNWQKIRSLTLDEQINSSLKFSNSSNVLFIGSRNSNTWESKVDIWDVNSFEYIHKLNGTDKASEMRIIGADDDKILINEYSRLHVFCAKTFKKLQTITEVRGWNITPDLARFIVRDYENSNAIVYAFTKKCTLEWLKTNLLPEQARIIARAHESSEKGKQLVLTKQSAIDIFNTFPDHVKQYLVNRFRILIELRGSRRSERLRNKKRKRDDILGGQPKRRKLNQEDEK